MLSDLTPAGTTFYSGILPSGLPSQWYIEAAAGDTIITAIYDNTFTLTFLGFRAGKAGQMATYGQVSLKINTITTDTYNMTAGAGSSGALTVSNVVVYNTFWEAADVTATIVQSAEGYADYQIVHTEAGDSNLIKAYYDNNALAPVFSVVPIVAVDTLVSKWLSGIEYFGYGTAFTITYTVQNAFRKVYSVSGVTRVTCTGMAGLDIDPPSVPAYTANFVVSSELFSLNNANESSLTPTLVVDVSKPNNPSATQASVNILSALGKAINTYGVVSTTTLEYFQDEAQRLVNGTNTAFNSTTSLANGHAQVQDGKLIYGSVDYPAKSGDQRYDRKVALSISNSGSIIFGGIASASEISPYNTGDLNIFLLLETDGLYYDLGRPFGSNNGTGTGDSPANSIGAVVSTSGNTVNFTFGIRSTADNSNQYRFIAVFKNSNKILTSLITS